MKVLAIESSCDESAVAIVDSDKKIFAHLIKSQIDIHQQFGGVIPELSARAHLEVIDHLILESLKQAKLKFSDIDAFAGTSGPGLIGGLIVGMTSAKTLCAIYNKPFLAINHLQGHALAIRLEKEVDFPFLVLLVSGGHCQILLCYGVNDFYKIGETIDDALGETFDKVAQMLGLPYPGGPEIEKLALLSTQRKFPLPRPLIDQKNHDHQFNFSFSGLKTAVRRTIEKITNEEFSHSSSAKKISINDKADLCASFQRTISEILCNRLENVINDCPEITKVNKSNLKLVITGGVACNKFIFNNLKDLSIKYNFKILIPQKELCTDNALMIAWAAIEKLKINSIDPLTFKPRAKWPLAELKLT
jgi:N6-L-threonylcarbamoyladenine synthase